MKETPELRSHPSESAPREAQARLASGKIGARTRTEPSSALSSVHDDGEGPATQRLAQSLEAAERQTRRLEQAISERRFLEARESAELLRTLGRAVDGALLHPSRRRGATGAVEELEARWKALAPRVGSLLKRAPTPDPNSGLDVLGLGHAEDEARWLASLSAAAPSTAGAAAAAHRRAPAAHGSAAPAPAPTVLTTSTIEDAVGAAGAAATTRAAASTASAVAPADTEAQSKAPHDATTPSTTTSAAVMAGAPADADADDDAAQVDVAKLAVRYRASWLLANPAPRALWGLQRLRAAGAISWASDDGLQRVVALTRWDQLPSARNTLTFVLTPAALSVLGLPPSHDVVAQLVGSGVEVALAMPVAGLPAATRIPLPDAERTRLAEALAELTGLSVLEEPEQELAVVGGAGVVVVLSSTQCERRFGHAAWQAVQRRLHARRSREAELAQEEEARFTLDELPARLTQHGGLVISGDAVPFEVEVDWPVAELKLLSTGARDRFVKRRSGFDVRWVVTRVDGPGHGKPQVYTSRGQSEALKRSLRLQLDKDERAGIFTVEATIGSNHWRPRTVATKVEVKTEEARMAELRADANGLGAGALAADGLVAHAHDFDIGLLDDKLSRRGDDHGTRFEGQLDALYQRRSLAERARAREAKIAHLSAARSYLQRRAGDKDVDAAIQAFDAEIAKLRRAGEELTEAVAAGWQTFEVRGTYLSRTLGVESGTLDLYGEVTLGSFSGVTTTHVRIRDLSRRFERESYVFTGSGNTFETALESAFVDFCKAYPAGRVALLAEVMAPTPHAAAAAGARGEPGSSPADTAPKLRATGAVLGFELPTTSRWKSLKAQVFTPLLQTLQGAATAMAMIFAPELAMPLVMAQVVMGSVQTIDDLLERSARGRLETQDLVMGFGQLAMNVLPLLGQARVVRSVQRAELALATEAAEASGPTVLTPQASLRAMKAVVAPSQVPMLALAGAEFAGNALLVSGQTYALLRRLHADDVAAIGDLYIELQRLAATTHPSDPELKRLQHEIEARAVAVRRRTMQAFTTCVGDQLAMWVPMQLLTVMGPLGPRRRRGVEEAGTDGRARDANHHAGAGEPVGAEPGAAPVAAAGEHGMPTHGPHEASAPPARAQVVGDPIRQGPPGRIRGASELTNHDVVTSLNAQLQAIRPDDVNAILARFPEASRAQARVVLARASEFGNVEALNALRVALQPHLDGGGRLYLPGSGSLADNLAYSAGKGSFDDLPGASGTLLTSRAIKANTVVILDAVILHKLQRDPAFARRLAEHHCVLLEPHGFNDGLNLFNTSSPEAIAERAGQLLRRAEELHQQAGESRTFEAAVDAALGEGARAILTAAEPSLHGQLQVVRAVDHPDVSTAAISDQLSGAAGISEQELASGLEHFPEDKQAYVRELLARQAEIFSPRRVAAALTEQHQHALAQAAQRGIAAEHVYFYIPAENKSYGMLAMAHREATGTPVEKYLNGPNDLRDRALGADTMIVVLDDVAGSGHSLRDALIHIESTKYPGQTLISPMVATEQANYLFNAPGFGITSHNAKASFQPREISKGLMESEFYQSLDAEQQKKLGKIFKYLGFGGNGLSMAFPYMAPDNNNSLFGDLFAKFFIANRNRRAAKSPTYNLEEDQ
ncbi:MAG: hypothetical protein R3B48_21230 [Kofleriaceae bacterium]